MTKEIKTIEYYFDGDALKYWDKETGVESFEEIDLNDFINWEEVYKKAEISMKENFPKGTIFVHIDDE